MVITEANQSDFDEIWNIFSAVVKTGTTYVYSPNTTKEQAFDIWMTRPKKTFVLRDINGVMKGTYYIKENRPDLGSHICRCGFMVLPSSRREGVGEAMCKHSLEESKKLGFRGMQLSYVVESNKASVNLWLKMGFTKVGQIPNAFQHQELGDVNVLIMYKSLTD
ncbi:MAG: GNAT family N-acetyltransferase [Candidatus Margulisiibacteriota bacterium]|nr:GNAT family N-acetyltransferase [Candidatus Margulisiibacteriota bacterium]